MHRTHKLFMPCFPIPHSRLASRVTFHAKKSPLVRHGGVDPDHPDMVWLKLKRFLVVKKLSNTEFISQDLVPALVEDYKQLIRLNRLLEDALT